jgi:hypothetical protein
MKFAPQLRKELARIIDAVAILSPSSFTFAGYPSSGLAMPMMGLKIEAGMPPLMTELVGQLYQHCYSNRFAGQVVKAQMPRPEIDEEWVETLSRANSSRERWEDGWQVAHTTPQGQAIARRGSINRVLNPGEFVNLSGSGMFLAPDASVRVYVPRDSRTMQPGYYFAFGETGADSADQLSVVRFYWNVSAEGAPRLLELISSGLNRWQVPFRFKTGSNPAILARSDSAVLYSPRRYAQITYELVLEIHERILPLLRAEVPLFSLPLAAGLAFAEDTGTQESFGMARCRTLAQGIWQAHKSGALAIEERLATVERQFEAEGIPLERPWLNAGSANEFEFAAVAAEAA